MVDHQTDDVYVAALHPSEDSGARGAAHVWIADTSRTIVAQQQAACDRQACTQVSEGVSGQSGFRPPAAADPGAAAAAAAAAGVQRSMAQESEAVCVGRTPSTSVPPFKLRRQRQQYMQDVESCLQVRYLW